MKAKEIYKELETISASLVTYSQNLSNTEANKTSNNKWSVNQNINHLTLSIKPINKALKLPKLVLRSLFKKPSRPLKKYDEVIASYQKMLSEGAKASGKYVPNKSPSFNSESLIMAYVSETKLLLNILSKWNENQLDSFFLPHPLLGKLSIRELMYFTIYHTKHHFNTIKKYTNE